MTAPKFLLIFLIGCAAPQTQIGSVSQDVVFIEQARQQQFALDNTIRQTSRLRAIAVPILIAAAPLCGERLRSEIGIVVGNAFSFAPDYIAAAQKLGYTDTLVVIDVAPNSPAQRAGLAKNDRILRVNETQLTPGRNAFEEWSRQTQGSTTRLQALPISYQRSGANRATTVDPVWSCAYTPQLAQSDAINAAADGQSLFITTGMMRFAQDDDELAAVIGHELAHNAMRHTDAAKKNTIMGGLLGAAADIAAAGLGVNTQGAFTKGGMEAGSQVFSQDFEREADYVGLYMLALTGRSLENVPTLWRRIGVEHPGSIKFGTSHPTTAERFVRLDQWRSEIDRKISSRLALTPELKKGSTAFATDRRLAGTTALASGGKTVESPARTPATTTRASMPQTVALTSEKSETTKSLASPSESSKTNQLPVVSPMPTQRSTGERAQSAIGAPSSDIDRTDAIVVHKAGHVYMGAHEWTKAEKAFRLALILDGSVAEYHASLGTLMMSLGRTVEAEAEFSAAMLIDVDNDKYRQLLKASRTRK